VIRAGRLRLLPRRPKPRHRFFARAGPAGSRAGGVFARPETGLRGWACRTRTRESVGALCNWDSL